MLAEDTIEFLKNVPPFDLLEPKELDMLVKGISMDYYPKGERILSVGEPNEYVWVIKKGAVKLYMDSAEGDDIIIDYRGVGEHFGFVSVVSGDPSRLNVSAVEDAICFLIPKELITGLVRSSSAVSEYLNSFFIGFIDKTYQETRKRHSLVGEGERTLFVTPVGEIIKRPPVMINREASIRDAATLMAREKVSSVLVTDNDESDLPVGIVTDRDLREKVVARARDVQDTAGAIMSEPLIRVNADEYCFEVLLKMIRYAIHHMLVVEGGQVKGIVTNHDFLVMQGNSPTSIIREIDDKQSFEELSSVRDNLVRIVGTLVREGARSGSVTGLITEITEKVLIRIVELLERKLGPAPVSYSLFAYGDAARRELTLNPYIRLGLLYEDIGDASALDATKRYFTEFRELFLEGFIKSRIVGTAENPEEVLREEFIKSSDEWNGMLAQWVSAPFRTDPVRGLFDARVIKGNNEPVESMRKYFMKIASESRDTMDYLASSTVKNRPPIGFLGKFVVDKSGSHKDEFNLFIKGIKPVVNAVRVLAVEKKATEISTEARLKKFAQQYDFEDAEDLSQVLKYLYTLVIHHEIELIEDGSEPDDFINPGRLGNFERRTLKEAFQLIARLYDLIEKRYPTERIA